MGMYARHLKVAGQQLVCFHHQIVLFIAGHSIARHLEVTIYGRGKLVGHEFHLQCIGEGDGIKHSLQLVIPVGAACHDVEAQIDFGARKCNHSRKY